MSDKYLVIAEKPSVAADIAKALGGLKKEKDYYEGERYVVSSALGHLLELSVPEKYDVKRGKWSFANLPVIPPEFSLTPIAKTEPRLKLLKKLMKREDITGLINACDAGREGELIFRYIVQAAKCKKPIQRLWLQSMTQSAISEAFTRLRTNEQMLNLADAARSRSEADWLVGINGTRAMTAFNNKDGGFFLTTVGRVQTPTLAIVVQRERDREAFVSRPYWEVAAEFSCGAGVYEGTWFNSAQDKSIKDRPEQIFDKAAAEAAAKRCQGKTAEVSDTKKRQMSLSPALYDLTTLQREANSRFGFSAKTTLSIAQSLYEKHKALTYPRTDSRALPEDYAPTVRQTLKHLTETGLGSFAQAVLDNHWVKPTKRVFDNSKISDHFAIIPTLQHPGKLSEAEEKIYTLVARRFIAVFFPAAVYDVTTRISKVGKDTFKSEGRILVDPGWTAVYGKEDLSETLPEVRSGETVKVRSVRIDEKATRPPARFNEATLLSAMEGAGKLVDNEELRFLMKGKGLGTPATRAAIIEGLIAQSYLRREGRELVPTVKARQLISLLKGLGENELCVPELTGSWEYKLAEIERGEMTRSQFMDEIRGLTRKIVDSAKRYEGDTVPIENPAHLKTPCPRCGGEIVETYRRFACTKCSFSITKFPAGRPFEIHEAEELLKNKEIGPLTGFISKTGRPFAGRLILTSAPDFKLEFEFDHPAAKPEEPVDVSTEPLGPCPKCAGRVFAGGTSYRCEHSADKTCDFRIGRTILGREITPEEIKVLLEKGSTPLLKGFVSKRTGKPFDAKLVITPKKDVGFAFENDRPAKTYRRKAAAKKA